LDAVDAAIATLTECSARYAIEVSYAAKAFATIEFVRHLAHHPIGLDVCSLGELVTAERAGFPAERITLHGAGKSDEELLAAIAGRLRYVVVDGIEELERLAALCAGQRRVEVILRLNVGIEAGVHAFVRTGGNESKFGIHSRDETAAIAILRANSNLRFAGLHAHLGSQIFSAEPFSANAGALLGAAERFAQQALLSERIIIGGGFGVRTNPEASEDTLDVAATAATIAQHVRREAAARGLATPHVGIEPGRAVVAAAGTTLYRVLAVKRQSHRAFAVVDGGLAENPRPALYGARHQVVAATRRTNEEFEVTLCGRSCENDELGAACLPHDLQAGDLLAMCVTGAYTYSMAGNYNRFPRPAVVAVSGGTSRLMARRESLDDVLGNDVDESGRLRAAF
jgi:diaminopimelate decarboxylase